VNDDPTRCGAPIAGDGFLRCGRFRPCAEHDRPRPADRTPARPAGPGVELVDVVTFADHLEALRRSTRTAAYALGLDPDRLPR
jgi:hypothetical protein